MKPRVYDDAQLHVSVDEASKPKLLVLTSLFHRWVDDRQPRFILDLCSRLSQAFDVHVLAPHATGAKRTDMFGSVVVTRFRYAPEQYETLACTGGILDRLRENPLRIVLVPGFIVSELMAACRLMRRHHFDVVHAHWIIPQGLAALLARKITRYRISIVCTSHGADLYGLNNAVLRWLKSYILRHCDAVTVVSQPMCEEVRRLRVPLDNVSVVSMGVDLKHRFHPLADVIRDSSTLLFVGRLAEKKGIKYAIAALPQILEKYPQTKLIVVGEGPEEQALRRMVGQLGLKEQVEFRGPLPHESLVDLYRTATIVVLPFVIAAGGDQEGLGLVLVEALGCGCPVITSELSAVKEVIQHGETGLLTRPGDTRSLANNVVRLLDDPELRDRLARAGCQGVSSKYDWSVIADRYRRLLISEVAARAGGL